MQLIGKDLGEMLQTFKKKNRKHSFLSIFVGK